MLRKLISRWGRNNDGVVAIEFSLVSIPFLMLALGIIELSLMYASASMLEGATGKAARLIRTGQVQQSGAAPQDMFRDAICNTALLFISCNDITIEVRQMDSYEDFGTMSPQFDADGNMTSQGFSPGGSNDRVLIRTAARYTMMTPFIGTLLAGSDSSMLFMSTVVLQTEPYEFDPDA